MKVFKEIETEIPKRIFYVWGFNEPLKPSVKWCIDSWKYNLPDYEIIQIDENSKKYFNFSQELEDNFYFKCVYERKLWAYVADYVRIKTLYNNGGIYFDTDVSVVKNIDKFLNCECFVGAQNEELVEPAILGSKKNNKFLGEILKFYGGKEIDDKDTWWNNNLYTIPKVFVYHFKKIYNFDNKFIEIIRLDDITIYPENYFIPFRWNTTFFPKCLHTHTHNSLVECKLE
jgi:mannosyltransferase OCH1-like enzyme